MQKFRAWIKLAKEIGRILKTVLHLMMKTLAVAVQLQVENYRFGVVVANAYFPAF